MSASCRSNLSRAVLVEEALARQEGALDSRGALAVVTGKHTGRSPRDRFIVAGPEDETLIDWGGPNRAMPADVAERLAGRVREYLGGRTTYLVDAHACAETRHRLGVRVVADLA